MDKKENDNGQMFHIRLNVYDRWALALMKARFGTSSSGAIRACIRACAHEIGFKSPHDSDNRP